MHRIAWDNVFAVGCLLLACLYNGFGKFITALVFVVIACVVKHYEAHERS